MPWQGFQMPGQRGAAAADTQLPAVQVQYGNASDANANSTDDRLRVALTLRYPNAILAQPQQAAMGTIYKQCALHELCRIGANMSVLCCASLITFVVLSRDMLSV